MTDTPHVPERRWGFIDDDGVFVAVPKTPLTLGGLTPPVTFQLFSGERTIIEEPDMPVSATQTGAEGA